MNHELASHTSSFRDPAGFIFEHGFSIYRQINTTGQADYDHLMNSGLYDKLVSKGLIVAHEEVADLKNFPRSTLRYKVIKPKRIPFVSYPYEWSFSQLKAAALLTLRVQRLALRHGMILKDSSAYNVQFVGKKPIFIDTLSFRICKPGSPWDGYKQYCEPVSPSEDGPKIAGAIKEGLTRENFAVDVEYDADSGLGAALNEPYDLMIIDRMLPGSIEGLEICRQVRDKRFHTPILLLTAKDQIGDRVEGLDAGADDYLVKPFSFDELLARIRALMRRPAKTTGTTLKVGDLTLDTISYEVKKSNRTIDLSSKEFALLEYLMRNPERILNKDAIISHVWNFDADVLPNTVEVYIGYLRNKIDRPDDKPNLIHTHRGFGYRLGLGKSKA